MGGDWGWRLEGVVPPPGSRPPPGQDGLQTPAPPPDPRSDLHLPGCRGRDSAGRGGGGPGGPPSWWGHTQTRETLCPPGRRAGSGKAPRLPVPAALRGEGVSRPAERRELVLSQSQQKGTAGPGTAPRPRRCPAGAGGRSCCTLSVPGFNGQPNPQIFHPA